MKILHAFLIAGGIVLGIYIGFFLLWFMLMTACIENGGECGGDTMTSIVGPLYPFLTR